jgi:hypothetical protein
VFTGVLSFHQPNSGGFVCLAALRLQQEPRRNDPNCDRAWRGQTPSLTQISAHYAQRDILPGSSFNHFWQNLTNRLIGGFNFIQFSRFAAFVFEFVTSEILPGGTLPHRENDWFFWY